MKIYEKQNMNGFFEVQNENFNSQFKILVFRSFQINETSAPRLRYTKGWDWALKYKCKYKFPLKEKGFFIFLLFVVDRF